MRLLQVSDEQPPTLIGPVAQNIPRYAILSHTWLKDQDEVNHGDMLHGTGISKVGYGKIRFCNDQAIKDDLKYFWADTCCIDKTNNSELSEAINSMFKWYQNADKCYVYLTDVHFDGVDATADRSMWISDFRKSRWFTRGWTLQELIAPRSVEFFSNERILLGSKISLEDDIHDITGIPLDALRGTPLKQFTTDERFAWAAQRQTSKEEDKAYCLFGIFNVFLPPIYGEGANAFVRLKEEVERISARDRTVPFPSNLPLQDEAKGSVERREIMAQARTFLETGLATPDTQCLLLYGLPGSGKTHLAQDLSQYWLSAGRPAYWFDASSPETFAQSSLHFVIAAGLLTFQEASSSGVHAVRQKLCAYLERSQQPWVLIFDNYDVFESSIRFSLNGTFPVISNGSVIITSRNAGLKNLFPNIHQTISVQAMNPAEARKLFCMACKVDEASIDDEAELSITLINTKLLGDLPLAVAQAGAFVGNMVENTIPFSQILKQYINEYLSNRDIVLREVDDKFILEYGQSIVTLFNMAFSAIEKKNDTASKLLLLFAFYHHRNISSTWFKRVSESLSRFPRTGIDLHSRSFSWFARLVKPQIMGTWSDHALKRALQLLQDYGLLDTLAGANMLHIHPLIHAWAMVFMIQQDESTARSLSHLAAALLCEVYDKQTDTDLRQSFKLKSQLWPHAEAWFSASHKHILSSTSSMRPALPGYVYNRIGDYLDSSNLPPAHEARGTVPELRLLALQSELSSNVICSRHIVWSLRQLTLWLVAKAELQGNIVKHMAFSLISGLIDRAEPTEAWETFDALTSRAEIYLEEMIVMRDDHRESVKVAKRGKKYISMHENNLTEADKVRLSAVFCKIIACFDEQSESRVSHFWELLDLYKRSEHSLGKSHFVTIRLLAQLAYAKTFNNSNEAISAVTLTSDDHDWRTDPDYKMARMGFIHLEMGGSSQRKVGWSPEKLKLTSEKHLIECEEQGEWNFLTLETELMMLDQKVHSQDISVKCPGIFGSERWVTRNDNLIVPIDVGIALLVTNQRHRTKLLWPGYLSYLALVKQSEQVVIDCEALLRQAANLCAQQNMPVEGGYLRTIAACLRTRNDEKHVTASMLVEFVENIYVLWQLLDRLEMTLQTPAVEGETATICSTLLQRLNVDHPVLKESLLYLLIQYLLYLTYQDQHRSQAFVSLTMLETLSTMTMKVFGSSHVLTYRWKVFEAITLRHINMADRALQVEEFLGEEMTQYFDQAEEGNWYSDEDRARTKDGKALTSAWRNARMVGRKVTTFANICLETLAFEYGNRKWFPAQISVSERRLRIRLEKEGIGSSDIPNLILVVIIACSKGEQWERMWTILVALGQNIAASPLPEQAKLGSLIFSEVASKLLGWKLDRSIVLLLDWFNLLAGLKQVSIDQKTLEMSRASWSVASFQRMAYFRLGFAFNAEQLSIQMLELQAHMEQLLEGSDETQLVNVKQNWKLEEEGWQKLRAES